MSFTRKIIDGARSGLSTVVERIAADDTPLSHVEPGALQAELEARAAARKEPPTSPLDNPVARLAQATETARRDRERIASERAARIQRDRDERARKQQAANDEAFRRMKEQAARGGPGPSSGPRPSVAGAASGGAGSGARSGARPSGFPFGRTDAKLLEHYKTLNLQPDADFAAVKTAYRQLMRKYHPDRHVANPGKQKAATELSTRVTVAYNALRDHFEEK